MDEKQIVVDYLRDLYKYHSDMYDKANVKIAKDHHYIAKRDIMNTIKLIGKGKSTVLRAECYDDCKK